AGRARSGSVSHSTRSPISAFTAPVEGFSSHFHTTPRASGALTHGSTYSTRSHEVPGSLRLIARASSRPRTIAVGMLIRVNSRVTHIELANRTEEKMSA